MQRILVGMSGGVDSAVAALLLEKAGYTVEGLTLLLLDSAVFPKTNHHKESKEAQNICRRLGIPHHTLDLRSEFLHYVADPFAQAYREGLTPNPCLSCNRHIKFGKLLDFARQKGFDGLATGHYARIMKDTDGRHFLLRAKALSKDQSYALFDIAPSALPHILFPLGEYGKVEIRAIAAAYSLPAANRPDSQDICFIREETYTDFINRRLGQAMPGKMYDTKGIAVGSHKGLESYTIGQRKGIGGYGEPKYVLSKNPANNSLTIGCENELYRRHVQATGINWFLKPQKRFRALVKLRYSHKGGMAWIEPSGEDANIFFDEAQRAPTPGQAAVFYEDDRLLGGGLVR